MILLSFFCGRPDAPDASTASPASDRRPLGDAAQFQTDADPRGRRKSFQTGTPRHDSTQTKKMEHIKQFEGKQLQILLHQSTCAEPYFFGA